MGKVDPVLHERLGNLIGSMGYELFGCEILPQGRQMVFRIYIDTEKGVTIDDCSRVSHQVSAMMDVDDTIQGRYFLEVSSPGINRPLFEPGHYRKVVGKQVKIRLHAPISQRRQFTGIVQSVEGEDICLLVEGAGEMIVPFSAIEKGNLIEDIHF
jgi:ribosome maturation factor RimP